jgi:predicted adenine nucleotide alpha hydrolase (AANH) superfamily ATPase
MKTDLEYLKENRGKKLLLHSCCGPCSTYVISYLKEYVDITVIYYNPNIYPEKEYIKRKEEQLKVLNNLNIPFLDSEYDSVKFNNYLAPYKDYKEGSIRCEMCFKYRLEYTAKQAKENNFDIFATTLSVSPHKNSDLINEIGLELENKYNVKYLISNFKKEDGYKKSIELSKKYNLYRQNYCGCVYSLNEKEN